MFFKSSINVLERRLSLNVVDLRYLEELVVREKLE
jgi:hypothetical protein